MTDKKYELRNYTGFERGFIKRFTLIFLSMLLLGFIGIFGSGLVGLLLGVKSGYIVGASIGLSFCLAFYMFLWFHLSVKRSKCPTCSGRLSEAKDPDEWILVCHNCKINWRANLGKQD